MIFYVIVKVKDNETFSGIRWDKGSERGPTGHSQPNISLTIEPIRNFERCFHLYWSPVMREIMLHFVKFVQFRCLIFRKRSSTRVINIHCLNTASIRLYPTPCHNVRHFCRGRQLFNAFNF